MRRRTPPGGVRLHEWKLGNFKSIPEAEFSFRPLTVLVGANSSGKSSVIQSVLVAAQAAQAESEGANIPLNGPLASLGGFSDIRCALAQKGSPVRLGGSIRLDGRITGGFLEIALPLEVNIDQLEVSWSVDCDSPAIDEPGSASISRIEVSVRAVEIKDELGVRSEANSQEMMTLRLDRRGQGPTAADAEQLWAGSLVSPRPTEFSLGFEGTLDLIEHDVTRVKGAQLVAGLPRGLLTSWQLAEAVARVWVQARTERPFWRNPAGVGVRTRSRGREELQKPVPLDEERSREAVERWSLMAVEEIQEWWKSEAKGGVALPLYLSQSRHRASRPSLAEPEERLALRRMSEELVDAITSRLTQRNDAQTLGDAVFTMGSDILLPPGTDVAGLLAQVVNEIVTFLRDGVVYLGPLRQDPQVVYRSTPFGATGFIGTKGEFMAPIVHAFRRKTVVCPLDLEDGGGVAERPLIEAVDYWTSRLDLAESVQTRDMGRLGIQVNVTRSERVPPLDLTSVGVGVSQMLPIIVTCLLTPPGSVILLEQPELHLHPAVQQKLGDFLLAVSRSGRQLIVETHSEYLVSRLRRRIAEDPTPITLQQTEVIFAEQFDDASRFRTIEMDEFGAIDEWPQGFFDQSATESRRILEEGLRKRLGETATEEP